MELFILPILLLCGCQANLLRGDAADCNDPEVFQAVDLALKAYNGDLIHGHTFALSVVLEAYRTEDLVRNIRVKYRVQETSCDVGTDTSWQNCQFLPPAEGDTGICEAEVYLDDTMDYHSIEQMCKITPAPSKVVTKLFNACLGCWEPIDPKSEELLPIISHMIVEFNNQSKESSLFHVQEVTKAKRQVVAGWNYEFKYSIKETNCSKDEFTDLIPECRLTPGGDEGTCIATAYVDIRNNLVRTNQKCKLRAEQTKPCPGCPVTISTDSKELKEPLDAALEKYNSESDDSFYYIVVHVTKATVQVVAGEMFRIEFEVKRSNCSKAEVSKLNEACVAFEKSMPLKCIASVYVRAWEHELVPKVKCERPDMMLFARRPAGFTPFRSAKLNLNLPPIEQSHKDGGEFIQEDTEKQEGNVATAKPNEEPPVFPVDPPSPQDDTLHSSRLFKTVTDLPEPKCPGKPWKPIIPPTEVVDEPRDFDLKDLLPAPGDENTAGSQEMVPLEMEQPSDPDITN